MDILLTIREAAESLSRDLHLSQTAIGRLKRELAHHLADVALGKEDAGRAAELRQDMAAHHRVLDETPDVLTELYAREGELQFQLQKNSRREGAEENDRRYFDQLKMIITEGVASPADIAQLRKLAVASSNHARKYDIDRLVDALEDHDRRVKTARQWGHKLPTFSFTLEEEGQ